MIDAYLQRSYGDNTRDPIVRRSRIELDGSVYCVILSTPQITQRFLRDPFHLFENSGINPSPPQFLYILNSNGIPPVSFNSRFTSSTSSYDPISQRQLDTVTAQCDAMAATVRSLADDQKLLSHNFQTAQNNITRAFADSTAVYAATNLVSTAQSELTSLQQSRTMLQLMSIIAPNPQAQAIILESTTDLTNRINSATVTRNSRATELQALQSRALPMLPYNDIPDLSIAPQDALMEESPSRLNVPSPRSPDASAHPSPSTSHKRARVSNTPDGDEDAQDADLIATQMEIDQHHSVCLFQTFHLFFLFLSFPSQFLMFPFSALLPNPCINFPVCTYFSNKKGLLFSFFFPVLPLLNTLLSPLRMPRIFFLSFLIFLYLFPTVSALPPLNPVLFRTISLNANGLADPMKIAAIQSMIHTSDPHAFVVGETKNALPVSSRLDLNNYDIHESPGRSLSGRGKGKWGVIVGIRRGLFNVQPVTVSDKLQGRVVALDLCIPTDHHLGFRHRLIGVYAPWNPGGTLDYENFFWPELTELCNLANHSWSVHGDLNATLHASESSSFSLTVPPSRLAYTNFLTSTNGLDLWRTQSDGNTDSSHQQFTFSARPTSTNPTPARSLIDRSAVSRTGTLAGSISILPNFIPCTDHKPIDTRITLLSPSPNYGEPNIPHEVPPSTYSPRFRYPFRSEKHRLALFSSKVDDLLSTHPQHLPTSHISSDTAFQQCYDDFSTLYTGPPHCRQGILQSPLSTPSNLPQNYQPNHHPSPS